MQIGGDLVNADKDKNTEKANELRKKWQNMMYSHLSMTEKEAGLRLKKEYPKDIEMFNMIENEALEMADYMSAGIIRQFCCNR